MGRSHVGHVRARNEDHFVISPERGLCAVADGIGGGPAGDVASKLACETLVSAMGEGATAAHAGDTLMSAFAAADRAVLDAGRTNRSLNGMGTTLSAIWFRDPAAANSTVCFGHVGDSRIYVLRPTGLEQITQDDTVAMDLVRQGDMTLAEAKRSIYWHYLSQSISGHAPIRPQTGEVDLKTATAVLLCSDGLSNMIGDAEIENILGGALDDLGEDSAEALVEAALRNGGGDNVTVIVLSRTG
ncbi:MAG: serine/threonine-protein phosphatase [Proteobacteria bacterium]|nr:serine/threonine-protein phosphatase [Pseudomonadota bacterium]